MILFMKNAVSKILNKIIENRLVDFSDFFLLSASYTKLQLAVCIKTMTIEMGNPKMEA